MEKARTKLRGWLLAGWAAAIVGVQARHVIWPFSDREGDWPWVMGLMAFPIAAALLLARRPGNIIGRLLALVGMAAGAIHLTAWYVLAYPDAPLSRQVEAIDTAGVVLSFAGLLGLLHLFPTGRPINRPHARVVTALWCYVVVAAALGVVRPGPLALTDRPNPFGLGPPSLSGLFDAGFAGVLVFVVLGFWVVVVRWRRAGPVERAQLKWFLAGATLVLIVAVMIASSQDEDPVSPAADVVASIVVMLAFWALPAAVVIAITRYRLFDIDRIVSRTVSYALLAGVLGLVYAGSVVGLQAVLPVRGSDLAVAASTLAVAALFRPLRGWLQRSVDRRFNRARYEAALVTKEFADRLRQEVDLNTVIHGLSAVVDRTVQPVSAAVWLRTATTSGREAHARPASLPS